MHGARPSRPPGRGCQSNPREKRLSSSRKLQNEVARGRKVAEGKGGRAGGRRLICPSALHQPSAALRHVAQGLGDPPSPGLGFKYLEIVLPFSAVTLPRAECDHAMCFDSFRDSGSRPDEISIQRLAGNSAARGPSRSPARPRARRAHNSSFPGEYNCQIASRTTTKEARFMSPPRAPFIPRLLRAAHLPAPLEMPPPAIARAEAPRRLPPESRKWRPLTRAPAFAQRRKREKRVFLESLPRRCRTRSGISSPSPPRVTPSESGS